MARDDRSVLERLEAEGRTAPRVTLGDTSDPPDPAGSNRVLRRSGRYAILGELAEGGVGEVLRGRDVDLGRDVALKVLREARRGDAEILQRFVEEAQIGGQLQHPGIVPVYELGIQPDERPFFAMKLVKGKTLSALLAEREDPVQRRRHFLKVFSQICQTMAYAHARGVVHRDLKTANVMVGSFGEVQVIDWGFAKVLSRGGIADEKQLPKPETTVVETLRTAREGSHSIAGSVMGTPAYMPPEQAMGLVDRLDERSDVFSLGAILCEILTGDPPYVGEDRLMQAAQARLDDAFARLDASGAADALVDLAKRCLAPMRRDRPRDAAKVAAAVDAHLAEVEARAWRAQVEAAEAAGAAARAREEASAERQARRQTRWIAAAVLLLLATGGVGVTWIGRERQAATDAAHAAIATAVAEAHTREGEGRLEDALAAADKARLLADEEGVDEAVRERTRVLHASLEAEVAKAEAAAAQHAREQALLTELEEVRAARWLSEQTTVSRYGSFDVFIGVRETDERYRALFARHAVDLSAEADPEEAAARLAASFPGVRVDLAAVLDDWAFLQASQEEATGTSPTLLGRVASVLDADPVREALRRALREGDAATLERLAGEIDPQVQGPRTLDLLGLGLEVVGRWEQAIAWYERALALYPVDVPLRVHLRGACHRVEPVRWGESLRHAAALIALRPEAQRPRTTLASVLLRAGRGAEAVPLLEDARRRWPDDLDVLALLGDCYLEAGRFQEATAAHKVVCDREPDISAHWVNYGLALNRLGRAQEGLAAYRRALELDPAEDTSRSNLIAALQRNLFTDEALALCDEWVARAPDSETPWSLRMDALKNARRYEEGLRTADAYVRLFPDSGTAHGERARMLNALDRPTEALAASDRALALDPSLILFHTVRAGILHALGRSDEARRVVEAVLRDHPDDGACLDTRSLLRRDSGDLEGALADTEALLRLSPHLAAWHDQRGFILSRLGRMEEALAAAREAVRLVPRSWPYHHNLTLRLKDLGRLEEAETVARQTVELGPQAWEAHSVLGTVLAARGLHEAGLEAYREASRLAPDALAPLDNVIVALMNLGRYPEAEVLARQAVERFPRSAQPWGRLAANLQGRAIEAGDPLLAEEAVSAQRRAMELEGNVSPASRLNLAHFLETAGHAAEALAIVEELTLEQPEDAAVRQMHANLLASLGRFDDALAQVRAFELLRPESVDPLLSRAWIRTQQGARDEALAILRTALERHPDSAGARAEIARILILGEPTIEALTEALRLLDEALHLEPRLAVAAQLRRIATRVHLMRLREAGRGEEAVAVARRAIDGGVRDATVYRQLAAALLDLQRFDESIEAGRELVKLDPDGLSSWWGLAQALQQVGRWSEAIEAFDEVVRLAPEDPQPHVSRGQLLLWNGRPLEAVEAFREALRLDPAHAPAHQMLWWALTMVTDGEEPIVAAREAREQHPDEAWAHANLATALHYAGRIEEALSVVREVQARQATLSADQQMVLAQWLPQFLPEARKWARTEARLEALAAGEEPPDDPSERARLACLLATRKRHAQALEQFMLTFEEAPELARDPLRPLRAFAASSAVVLGTGRARGDGADHLTEEEERAWRNRALEWLRAQFLIFDGAPGQARQFLPGWLYDTSLAGVRDAEALAKLPADERAAWEALWGKVRAAVEALAR